MDTIYTPEEIADLLEMDLNQVTDYLDTGLFSGFKVDSYWRITGAALDQSMNVLQGIERSSQLNGVGVESSTSGSVSVPLPRVPIAVENPKPDQHEAVGQLLVFSDVPGELVYLDGNLKGPTTLSVMNIAIGNHEITIGEITSSVSVVKNYQLRVSKRDGEITVLSHPRIVARGELTEDSDEHGVEEYRLSIDVENETDFAGEFTITVSAEKASLNAELFGLLDGEVHSRGLRINEFVPDHDVASLFNGTIKAHPGDRIFISVPRQEGFNNTTELVAVMQADSYIKLILTNSGLLGRKQAIKFKVQSAPH